MLFNSYTFMIAFLPLAIVAFFALGRLLGVAWATASLVVSSLVYYGWWNPAFLWLIGASILFNYGVGLLFRPGLLGPGARLATLVAGCAANLGLLGYYKYANFSADTLRALTGVDLGLPDIVLPLAISFFTFQQIAYLVDACRNETHEYRFMDYCLFVTFFPQLIAGPIVHHKEMLPQFARRDILRIRPANLAIGFSIFTVGLFKKVVLADQVALYATPIFDGVSMQSPPTAAEAWIGAVAYTLQLYFDFSGYSDMAVGLARVFGIRLPLNFNSPYKATNIAEFWRRWHITLSRFLRDYLYIPLGGNRRGEGRRLSNLMLTMLLGGLWHGAGWTFVVWGGLHGLYLVVHRAWSKWTAGRVSAPAARIPALLLAWAVTQLAVVVGWVFFRATSFDAAIAMLRGMGGLGAPGLASRVGLAEPVLVIGAVTLIAVLAPNTTEIFARYQPVVDMKAHGIRPPRRRWLRFRPTPLHALLIGAMFVIAWASLSRATEFLYFQF